MISSPLRLFFLAALLAVSGFVAHAVPLAVPAHAQARVTSAPKTEGVQVNVMPDRADWTYEVGAPVKFTATVLRDGQPVTDAKVTYQVGPETRPTTNGIATLSGGHAQIDGGTLTVPGFIRCTVTVELDGQSYRGLATAGFSPEKIQPTQTEPADFDYFWTAAKAELAQVPIEPQLTPMPERSNDKVAVYHVSFRNVGSGRAPNFPRIYGVLCVPKAPGKYPAILDVPGAGVRPYGGVRGIAERGAITLQIGIHGIPVNLPKELYDQLAVGALNGYNVFNLDDRYAYYFRRVYLGCIRANDFLTSLPEYDGENLVVMGGSQGGQLAIVTAALDPRVKALAARYPAYCDVTGYLHGRAGGWPHMFNVRSGGRPSPHATPEKIAVTAYYDVVNFARRITVPGHYTWGYNDLTCPPTSIYAAYNLINAPKVLTVAVEAGHAALPEQSAVERKWVLDRLNLK
jgi:cephalosporin-C deacetylase